MDNIFRYDNKFFEILDKITDIIVLNLLCIFFSLPVITMGASITAMYSVSMKMAKGKEPYIIKEFIKGFKENFRDATISWILITIVVTVLGLDFYISKMIFSDTLKIVFQFIFTLVSIILVFVLTYIFPIISKFNNTIKQTIINSILIPIQNLPNTILMVLINLSPVIMILILKNYWGEILFFYTVIGYGIVSYINSILLNKILDRYI